MVARSLHDWSVSLDGSHQVYTKPLEVPDSDDREYRLLRLANHLEVLLISDPETDRASAALDVHVGNLSDPDNLEGLAHFCEHLLFMGTEKYPKENDYYSYLSEHSGYANAYTATENTNYYFEVGHQWLEGALDRFARFFIDPLFSESCTERELRAVDSEHKKNLQSDCWRVAQVEKTLSNPNHPWRHFETGNLETLMEAPKRRGCDVRQELLKFHETHYSANIMKLCVLGKDSLDQLTAWVTEKFSPVVNKNLQLPTFEGHPLTENELNTQIFVKSVKHNRTLDVTFPFPDQVQYFESQPTHYISHLIGHEGPGSILSFLKKNSWATYLSAGACYGGRGFGFFHIFVELTEEGLERYQEVVATLFQYINMLKKVGVKKWIFDEVQKLEEIDFKFTEKCPPSQYTSWLAQHMQQAFPPQWTVSGASLLRKFDPQVIDEHLALLRPDNFRLTIASQEFPQGIKCTQVEKWYGTEYHVQPIGPDLQQTLVNLKPNEAFRLPAPNEFLPTELDVIKNPVKTKQAKPDLIQETSMIRLWYKKDDTFWVPKTNVWVMLRNPLTYATPRNAAITYLYINLLEDSLTEYSYNAEVSGLSYSLDMDQAGISLNVAGYSDKLPLLLEKVVEKMKHLQITKESFNVMKDQVKRAYRNFFLEPPFQHATYYLTYAIREKMWTCEELSRELTDIQIHDVQEFYPTILSHLHIETLVHGNLEQERAIQMMRRVQDILDARPLMPSQFISSRTLGLPDGQSYVYQIPVFDADNVNSAIEYYCQICDVTNVPLRARLSLIAQIAQEPCFNQLRTREQLGYLVFSGVRRHVGTVGLRFLIQSERSTVHLEHRVEEFLVLLRDIIVKMSEKDYLAQVDSLVADKQEKFKNMGQEGAKYWGDIEWGYYEFDDAEKDVTEVRTVDKASLLEFFDTFLDPKSPQFRKLSVHLTSQKTVPGSNKLDITSLHACLTPQMRDMLTFDQLKKAVGTDISAGLPVEVILRKLLVDELKAKEADVENMIAKVVQQLTEGPSVPTEEQDYPHLRKDNIVIDDLIKFKNQMPLSAAAVPFFLFSHI